MATNNPTPRPPPASNNSHHLPPKAPQTTATRSLQEHLALTSSARSRTHTPSSSSIGNGSINGSSVASDSSREGLRREVLRRRQSLTSSEFTFLQGIVANGTEVEVQLVQQKLCDPSLCFDVNDDDDDNTHDNEEEDTVEQEQAKAAAASQSSGLTQDSHVHG